MKLKFTREYTEEEIDIIARFLGNHEYERNHIRGWIRSEMLKFQTERYNAAMSAIR